MLTDPPEDLQSNIDDEEFKKSVLMYLSLINNGIQSLSETIERSRAQNEEI